VNTHDNTAASALLDVARDWVHIESPEEEVNPRELARWLASWRIEAAGCIGGEAGAHGQGPCESLVSEALSVDGKCSPIEFVEWFIQWRERAIAAIADGQRGHEIAGVPLHSALSLLTFQFEDDLGEEAVAFVREVMTEIERNGFKGAGCGSADRLAADLVAYVESLPPKADVITRVYRDLILDTVREKLAEHARLIRT